MASEDFVNMLYNQEAQIKRSLRLARATANRANRYCERWMQDPNKISRFDDIHKMQRDIRIVLSRCDKIETEYVNDQDYEKADKALNDLLEQARQNKNILNEWIEQDKWKPKP